VKITFLSYYITNMRSKVFIEMHATQSTRGIHLVDLSNMFDEYSNEIFADDIHIRQSAKNIVAQELFKQLLTTFGTTKFQKWK